MNDLAAYRFKVWAWPDDQGTPWKTNSYMLAVIYKIIRTIRCDGVVEIHCHDATGSFIKII